MASVDKMPTLQSPGWLLPMILVVYGAFAFFTAYLIIDNISDFRDKVLRKLPAHLRNNSSVQDTVTAIVYITASIFWPAIIAVALPTIAVLWLVTQIQQFRQRILARRRTTQDPDIEMGVLNPEGGEDRRNGTGENHQAGESPIHNMPTAQIREPPPPYRPHPSVLETLQTQHIQTSDRNPDRYIGFFNDLREPDAVIQSGSRYTMVPRR